MIDERDRKDDYIERLEQQVEQLRVQLAACLTAAEGHIAEPATRASYGWSLAYERTVELRQSRDAALADLESALTENDALTRQIGALVAGLLPPGRGEEGEGWTETNTSTGTVSSMSSMSG